MKRCCLSIGWCLFAVLLSGGGVAVGGTSLPRNGVLGGENECSKRPQFLRATCANELFPVTRARPLIDAVATTRTCQRPVVFLAPLYGAAGKATSSTAVLESMLRYQLQPALPVFGAINLVPYEFMQAPYARVYANSCERDRPADDYLRDARLIGADVCVYGRADTKDDDVLVELALVDMNTSRAAKLVRTVKRSQLASLLHECVTAVAQTCGLTETDLDLCGMGKDTPTPDGSSLAIALTVPQEIDSAQARKVMGLCKTPNPWLYQYLCKRLSDDGGVAFLNKGLLRWPDDPRLLLAKAEYLLRQGSLYDGYLLLCEFVCRQGNSLMSVSEMAHWLPVVTRMGSKHVDLTLYAAGNSAGMKQADALLHLYPENYALRFARGLHETRVSGVASLAAYCELAAAGSAPSDEGGVHSADARAQQAADKYRDLPQRALADYRSVVQSRPDYASALTAMMTQMDLNGQLIDATSSGLSECSRAVLLDRIHSLDPLDVSADMLVARRLRCTDRSAYLKLIAQTVERTKGSPIASNAVSQWLAKFLETSDYSTSSPDVDLSTSSALSEGRLFDDALERAMGAQLSISLDQARAAEALAVRFPELASTAKAIRAYKNRHHQAAEMAAKRHDWEGALLHARVARELSAGEEYESMTCRVIMSLCELKRRREALYVADEGTLNLPQSAKLYYTFAVVADDLGDRLEEALLRAKTAVQLSKGNSAYTEIVSRLEKKLHKPSEDRD